jgi:hypothetical protein
MSLFGRISKFAKSPQGKKLMKQAQGVAKDPKTKQKIADARERLARKDKPGGTGTSGTPGGTDASGTPGGTDASGTPGS